MEPISPRWGKFAPRGAMTQNSPRRTGPNTFEALQIVKSAYRNGVLSASDEAASHMAADWDFGGLIDGEDNVDPV